MNTISLDLERAREAAATTGTEPVTGAEITTTDTADEYAFTAWINKTLRAVLCVGHHGGSPAYQVTFFA
jgi:hypothetical protein